MGHNLCISVSLKTKRSIHQDSQLPSLAGLTPMAPYIAFAIVEVVRMTGTPESSTALGKVAPVFEKPSGIAELTPFQCTESPRTLTFQNSVPILSLTSVEYLILLGSGIRPDGCRPIPRTEGMRSEPGRPKAKERKRAPGACETGVIPNRFDAQAAPSGLLPTTGGIELAMRELSGKARPRIPLKFGLRGSSSTLLTAPVGY